MKWSFILDNLVKYVGVAGFVLSVINLISSVYARRTKLEGRNAMIVIRNPKQTACFVEFDLINRSAAPVSVHSLSLDLAGDMWESADIRDMAKKNAGKPDASTHPLASALPIYLAGYASQHVSIQFDRRCKPESDPLPLPADSHQEHPPIEIALTLYTSRKVQEIVLDAHLGGFEEWARGVVYGKDF